MKETPDCDAQEIALMCDIEEALVAKYLLSLPLTPDQKARVSELFQSNCSTRDIANMLKLSIEKVDEYVEKTFITLDREHKMDMQITEMKQIVKTFGNTQLTFHSSRMIVSDSFEEKIQKSDWSSKKPKNAFNELLPQIFYYLRCSLPLEDLSNMIMLSYRGVFTTHDLFHLIFQLSDPVLRGFCIENYSFSNPVPLVYTQLPKLNSARLTTTVCEELWYTLEDFNGLVSFGIGRASWNPVGKSYLLDLIFETDFVKGSPQGSAFHYSSIDIQMTRNLFGEMKGTSIKESTKWAYIDCHGESNVDYIQVICQHIGIALIHVTYHDFMNNREIVDSDIKKFTTNVKYIYLLIRDCEKAEDVKREEKKISGKTINFVYIPNLTKCNVRRIPFVKNALKKFGNEILHLEHDTINSLFIEILLADSKCDCLMDIQSGKELIKMITNYIHKVTTRSLGGKDVDFSFLRYYPNFVEYMSCYHKAAFATDHETISRLNSRCARLQDKYQTIGIGEVARHFNEIMNLKNSTLFIWKLSKELTNLSKLIQEKPLLMRDEITEQKNTKFIIEILWREALLTHKYQPRDKTYAEKFAQNFSNHVERGEAFELIDGDNLRFFNRDIDELLRGLYEKRMLELEIKNRGKKILIKQAPIIVSIIGPQSSGKSTLLNYCFGCKFLTSAGRCTRGIYGSLSKLSRPVNLTEHFLILDTEGLDAIERGNIQDTSHIHFDRTMVLFCLSVSQVVIINVKGDLGSEMQNLLQICAYSLNKLKVSKVAVPKIFFVLNQQADPDQSKHIGSINSLLEKLDKESGLMDAGDIKISDFIQISQENLFILPSAFNSEQINKPNAQLFSSNVSKLSPTVEFAGKCAEIRLAIINQLDNMPIDDRQPFGTMSEWMDMAGTVWETIVKYQDIVKYRNVEELMCSRLLNDTVSNLMKTHIYEKKHIFMETTAKLEHEINRIKALENPNITLTEKMSEFDQVFKIHQDRCLTEFSDKCQYDSRLKKLQHLCGEAKSNLSRLIYVERKIYSDKLKFQIHAVYTEFKLSQSMKKFQELIINNVDSYLEMTVNAQKAVFERVWMDCFRGDDKGEDAIERDENFHDLYSVFRMESKTMEKEATIYDIFRRLNFKMESVIPQIESDILSRFNAKSSDLETSDQFIFTFENNTPIKSMTPYPGKSKFQYFGKDTLFSFKIERSWIFWKKENFTISPWVPKECHTLVRYSSGLFDTIDMVWNPEKRKQRLLLASRLKCPNNANISTWMSLILKLHSETENFIRKDASISQGTVKEIINLLYSQLQIINYEIDYIGVKLTNAAECSIVTLLFAYAFKSLWNAKTIKRMGSREKTEIEKRRLLQYFLQKIENRKMVRGNWDPKKMKESDQQFSENFAQEFIKGVKRGLITAEKSIVEIRYQERKEQLSHENILLSVNDMVSREIKNTPDNAVINVDNFVVQYICDRNELLRDVFLQNWYRIEDELYHLAVGNMRIKFKKLIDTTIAIFETLLASLTAKSLESGISPKKALDSDNYFEICTESTISLFRKLTVKEIPFKAMVVYLQMYLDPKVTPDQFRNTFKSNFEVNGVKIKASDRLILCEKPIFFDPILQEEIFRRLNNTKMFNNENIFNISDYLTRFIYILRDCEFNLTQDVFKELVKPMKEESQKGAIGCPSQCPSCGKLCERELHPNDGKCRIKTGHQICSMGGKVWHHDSEQTAVLFMCDDFKDDTKVVLPGYNTNWGKFKAKCGFAWDWTLPEEEKYVILQRHNRKKMMQIWNKFGEAIMQYYSHEGTHIKYVPYTSFDDICNTHSLGAKYFICFVIDGTGSMRTDIEKARISVGQFIDKYKEWDSEFKIVVYRDHCDKNIIEMFPCNRSFTTDFKSIQRFLRRVQPEGGGDDAEAVLDGLATAANKCEWICKPGVRNLIIHIYDAPPHGDFPNYTAHTSKSDRKNCCCCNSGKLCHFNWKKDVWGVLRKFQIQYHGINTGESLPGYETLMKSKLKSLCGDFQNVDKDVVNDAVLQIFIDFQIDYLSS